MSRHAGVTVPLFSVPSSDSWGIGEFADLEPFTAWLAGAGFDRLMLLPVGLAAAGETSPYSAASAMALDPTYLSMSRVPEFGRAGGEAALGEDGRDALARARAATAISYEDVRTAKAAAIDLAAAAFRAGSDEHRAASFRDFVAAESWWLDDLTLFQALSEAHDGRAWWDWPEPLRRRDGDALDGARRDHADRIGRHQFAQWAADEQWRRARAASTRHGVALLGDLPFTVGRNSADVWARQDIFRLDVSTGAPPDAFSATGQNWHLPFFDWHALRESGYDWLRDRAKRMAALFDGLRVDHLVGMYRTYGIPRDGEPFFSPPDEGDQVRQGEDVLRLFQETGLLIIAEDLGTVPDFVRESMARLGVPGSKVLRWERDWHAPGQPVLDPANYPPVSAAMTGTHDTEPLAAWWRAMSPADRDAFAAIPALRSRGIDGGAAWSGQVRDALLEAVYESASEEIVMPLADVFGWDDRINTPGTIGHENWTWRLPWPVDALEAQPEARDRSSFCRRSALASSRADTVPG